MAQVNGFADCPRICGTCSTRFALCLLYSSESFELKKLKGAGVLVGYHVQQDNGSLIGHKRWTLDVHAPLHDAQQVQQTSAYASHVKIQGDRTIRFRYLNPNMGVVIAENHEGVQHYRQFALWSHVGMFSGAAYHGRSIGRAKPTSCVGHSATREQQ